MTTSPGITMSEPKRLIIYSTLKEMEECLVGQWLKASKTVFWRLSGGTMSGERFDEIIIMPNTTFGRHLNLTALQQDEVRRFMLEDLPTRLKPGGRIFDLNELTGDLNGQTEPNSSD